MTAQHVRRVLTGAVAVFFCYLCFCQSFFITHARGSIFRPLSSLVLIPAAEVRGEMVSYRTVVEMTKALQIFGDQTEGKEAFKHALSLCVYRLYVQSLADDLDVAVSREELKAYPLEDDALMADLETLHWSEQQYRKYMIEPLLLSRKVQTAIDEDAGYQQTALANMEAARKKIVQGMPFTDAAEQYSEDPSAAARGDLGIMSVGDVPVWLQPALSLQPGDISQVLDADSAYWTVTMLEFYPSDVPENAAVHFRGLAIKKKAFGAVVDDLMSNSPAFVFVW